MQALPLHTFPNRLSLLLHYTGLNQRQFADKLGVSHGFFSDVLRGKKKAGSEFLYSIHDIFSVSVDWLLTGKGPYLFVGGVDRNFLNVISTHISLVKAAVVKNNDQAIDLVTRLTEQPLEGSGALAEWQELTTKTELSPSELTLACDIYEAVMALPDPSERIGRSLELSLTWAKNKGKLIEGNTGA